MADNKIAGVMRAGAYSPNHIGNDSAIFYSVAEQLHKRGFEVKIYSEEQFQTQKIEEEIILDMCRERKSIDKLQEMEDNGCLVINSGYGVENCTRERMTRILLGNDIPYPESLIVNTNEDVRGELQKHGFSDCWVKRGDFHAMHKEDVSYCRHIEETQEVLHEYFYRGIKRAVINRHLIGDLIKFYGVQGQPFFYWFYPFNAGYSKYGNEAVNGVSRNYEFDHSLLESFCDRASRLMDVKIYGGDCIVDPDGTVRIIDFNDWPSFAPCRAEAAPYIAKCVMKAVKEWRKRR